MTTKELLALDAGTQVMHNRTTVIFTRVKEYPDKHLEGLYFSSKDGTLIHASYLQNEVMRYN